MCVCVYILIYIIHKRKRKEGNVDPKEREKMETEEKEKQNPKIGGLWHPKSKTKTNYWVLVGRSSNVLFLPPPFPGNRSEWPSSKTRSKRLGEETEKKRIRICFRKFYPYRSFRFIKYRKKPALTRPQYIKPRENGNKKEKETHKWTMWGPPGLTGDVTFLSLEKESVIPVSIVVLMSFILVYRLYCPRHYETVVNSLEVPLLSPLKISHSMFNGVRRIFYKMSLSSFFLVFIFKFLRNVRLGIDAKV